MSAPPAPLAMREFLGLEAADGNRLWRLPVSRGICGGRDSIYGGCALAAAIEAAEGATGRPAIWSACHFLRPAHLGETVLLRVEVSAAGRAVSHARVVAEVGDRELFICLLACGTRSFPVAGSWAQMPRVPDPEGLPARYIRAANKGGLRERVEERAVTDDADGVMHAPDGRAAVWVRLPGGIPAAASALAVVGDQVSTGASAVIEPDMQAPSIDNTLRVLRPVACDWVLAEIELRGAARGFVHGFVNLWSRDGQLLGIASQSGALRVRGT